MEVINWKQLIGNKWSKGIDSAMASKAGYVAYQKMKLPGEKMARPFKVIYDEEYLLGYILRKILLPLSYLGEVKAKEIIAKAWDLYEEESA